MDKHHTSSNDPERTPLEDFINDPSVSFDEWRSTRMKKKFGTDNLGFEYLPAGKGVVLDRWTRQPLAIPSTLAFDTALTSKEKLICLTIRSASNAVNYGGDAYQPLTDDENLAKMFDMTEQELSVAVHKLHDMGYLTLAGEEQSPDMNRRNVYEHLVEELGYKYNYEKYSEAEAARELEKKNQPPKRAKRSISSSMRLRVYKNDGYQCVVCASNKDLVVDHIVPLAKGGTNERDNLQTMCSPCNLSKGVKTMDEWLAARGESE